MEGLYIPITAILGSEYPLAGTAYVDINCPFSPHLPSSCWVVQKLSSNLYGSESLQKRQTFLFYLVKFLGISRRVKVRNTIIRQQIGKESIITEIEQKQLTSAFPKLFFKWGPLLLVRMFYGPPYSCTPLKANCLRFSTTVCDTQFTFI
jgi:hypothetical protein